MNHAGIIDLVPASLRQRWIEDGTYPNKPVFTLFAEKAQAHPDKLAVLSPQGNISYSALMDASLRLAANLRRAGIMAGDVVAYQLSNHWVCCAIDLAAAALGAIVAPFPPGRGKLDIQSLVRRCDARAVIVPHEYAGIDLCEVIDPVFRKREALSQQSCKQYNVRSFYLPYARDMAVNTDQAVLNLDSASLGYGAFTVLADVSMTVRKGQVVAMMGGSGSGKTTLLRAATGQIRAQKGTVTVFGQDLAKLDGEALRQTRQRMGVLFQQGALFTDLNVFENVAFPLRELTNDSEPAIENRVLDKLNAVGLRAAAHLGINEISGGMARRVALARAIVLEPELILYDEPFAGLDPISMGITAQLIRDLTDRLNCASVLITHDVAESFAIADRSCLVKPGCQVTPSTSGWGPQPGR